MRWAWPILKEGLNSLRVIQVLALECFDPLPFARHEQDTTMSNTEGEDR